MRAFTPGASQSVSATAANTAAAVTAEHSILRVANLGADPVYINIGGEATTDDMAVPAGTVDYFCKGRETVVGVICAATKTATVTLTTGEAYA